MSDPVFLKIATFYWHWIGVTLALGQASSSSSCRSATAARGGGSTGRAAAADCTPGPTAANQLHLYGTRNRRLVWTLNRFAVFFFDIVWAGLSVTAYTSCLFRRHSKSVLSRRFQHFAECFLLRLATERVVAEIGDPAEHQQNRTLKTEDDELTAWL